MKSVYLKCTSVCAGMAFIVWVYGGIFAANEFKEYMRILSDGLFTAGALAACFGGLAFAANYGAFDIFGYVANAFFARIARALKLRKAHIYADFYEYKGDKRTKRRAFPPVFVGAAFIAASALCLALYYM